jgi:hypothetical protein
MKRDSRIDPDRLREVLRYNPKTGRFVWLSPSNRRIRKGSVAGCVTRWGYLQIGLDCKNFFAHRLAWLFVHGDLPASGLVHRDGNKRNNALANLRPRALLTKVRRR